MPRMTGGEATVQALLAQGVDTLFVLPGVQNDALLSALYEAAERLKVIVTRHEQAAGYMAFGYAAASGRPGRLLRRARPRLSQHHRGARHRVRVQCSGRCACPARCRCAV